MSEFIFSTESVNNLSGRNMLSESAQSFVVERALVRDHPIDFQVTVGLVDSASPNRVLWYADVQPDQEQMRWHPQSGFGSMLPYDVVDTSKALIAGGIRLSHEDEEIALIPPFTDPRATILGIPVLRQLMVRDTTPDLKYMSKAENLDPLVIPSLSEIETVRSERGTGLLSRLKQRTAHSSQ